jgi:ABC-type glutathione transport system ATPase component
MTVLMVTHDAAIVAEYAQRLVVIAGGQVVLDGPPAQVFRQTEALAAAKIVPPPVPSLVRRLERDGTGVSNAVTVAQLADALSGVFHA